MMGHGREHSSQETPKSYPIVLLVPTLGPSVGSTMRLGDWRAGLMPSDAYGSMTNATFIAFAVTLRQSRKVIGSARHDQLVEALPDWSAQ
jgi:hypothetical protein